MERNYDSQSVGVCGRIASSRGEAVAAAAGKRWSSRDEQRCGFGTQPCAACVEEEVVERRLSAKGARALSLKLAAVGLLLETNFKLSERGKDLSPGYGIFRLFEESVVPDPQPHEFLKLVLKKGYCWRQ